MDVRLIPVKVRQRLNKLSSSDYDNLEPWQIVEAFNKFQLEWVRNQIQGTNMRKDGAESTIRKVDDLQSLLKPLQLKGINRDYYFESTKLPEDYLDYSRVTLYASKGECKRQRLRGRLVEEANIDIYLDDPNINPSFIWRSTLVTLVGDRIRVYTNKDFIIDEIDGLYYRYPRPISLSGVKDINDNPGTNINPEFSDDIVEILIDGAAAILAGDIQDLNQNQILTNRTDKNT